MRMWIRAGFALGAVWMAMAVWQTAACAQEKGGENETGPYEVVTAVSYTHLTLPTILRV